MYDEVFIGGGCDFDIDRFEFLVEALVIDVARR